MSRTSLKSCESLTIEAVLYDIHHKKSGRISKLSVLTPQGLCEIKASKFLRVCKDRNPAPHDVVKLKVLKKQKGGRVKLKAFELKVTGTANTLKAKACKPMELSLCQSSSCRKRGAEKLRTQLEKALSQSTQPTVRVTTSKCLGKCKLGPVAKCKPSGKVYSKLDSKTALSLIKL